MQLESLHTLILELNTDEFGIIMVYISKKDHSCIPSWMDGSVKWFILQKLAIYMLVSTES